MYKIYYYFRVYQHFLINDKLDDDSDTISVDDLVEFVKNHINEDERNELLTFCKQAY